MFRQEPIRDELTVDGQLEWNLDAKGRETVRHDRQKHFTGKVVYRDCGTSRRRQTRFKSVLPGWCRRDRRPQNRRFMPRYTARVIHWGRRLVPMLVTSRWIWVLIMRDGELRCQRTHRPCQHQNQSNDPDTRFHAYVIQMHKVNKWRVGAETRRETPNS